MKTKLLLPHNFKIIGWCIFIPAIIFGVYLTIPNSEHLMIQAKTFAIAGDAAIFGDSVNFGFLTTDILPTLTVFW